MSCFVASIENFEQKKTSKFHLELNFNNFQGSKKWKSFKLIAMIFSLFGLKLLDLTSTY